LLTPSLPWLAIFGLLTLKANRRWSAWWIWLPLACVATGTAVGWGSIEPGLQELRSAPWLKQILSVLFDAPLALALAVAALTLLVPRLDCTERFGSSMRVLVLLTALCAASFAVAGLWHEALGEGAVALLFLPGLVAVNVAAAVVVAGCVCRRRHPLWLCLWFPVSLAVLSIAVAVPVYYVAVAVCPIPLSTLSRLIIPIGVLLSVSILVTLLPFLVLILASPLFRGRIKALFCLAELPRPPRPGRLSDTRPAASAPAFKR
jgi:hypothetical protein